MIKLVSIFFVLIMLFCSIIAFAEDGMCVVTIEGSAIETAPLLIENVKLEVETVINGYAKIIPYGFEYKDRIYQYKGDDPRYYNLYESGLDAEFAILRMDITNISSKPRDFLDFCEVKVFSDYDNEYCGWFYQIDFNNKVSNHFRIEDKNKQNILWPIEQEDFYSIDPLYQGHYMFGCTIPNAVVNGKQPLYIVITIDGHEIVYKIRD